MAGKKNRFYYLEPSLNTVFIYAFEPVLSEGSTLQFLGSTDNPFPKMAASAFLNNTPGHKLIDYTAEPV